MTNKVMSVPYFANNINIGRYLAIYVTLAAGPTPLSVLCEPKKRYRKSTLLIYLIHWFVVDVTV